LESFVGFLYTKGAIRVTAAAAFFEKQEVFQSFVITIALVFILQYNR